MSDTFSFSDRHDGPGLCALLAALLLIVLPGCGGGGGLSELEKDQKGEKDSVGALVAQGAKVEERRFAKVHDSGYVVNLSGATITEDTFRNLAGLKRVAELDLSNSSITDDQLEHFNEVPPFYLARLDLSQTGVTDAGLDKLNRLYVLMNLNLARTKATPEAVKRLQKRRVDDPLTMFKALPKVVWK